MSGAKIAVFIPSMAGGGAERVALFFADSLAAEGYEVDLVVARNVGPLRNDPVARRLGIDLGAPNEMLCLPHLVRYLRRAKPDLMIAFVHSAKIMAGLAKLFVPGLRLAISVHNNLELPAADRFWFRRFLGYGPERYLYRHVVAAHTVSAALAAQVERLFGLAAERIYPIYNPLIETGPPSILPPSHNELYDRPVIVNAGRMVPQKDQSSLIRAFFESKLAGSARLLILGDGPLRGSLESLVGELGLDRDIVMPGRVADIRPYLGGAAGFALSSRFEGFPLVLLEALRAGLPIVAYDCPTGPAEALLAGTLGRLLPPGDLPGLGQAMRDMVAGDLVAADPSSAAAQLARFAPATIAQSYASLVRDCLAIPQDDALG